ncbi:MAG TPA: MDR family MFS transporter [Ktedonobacterales bacterium]
MATVSQASEIPSQRPAALEEVETPRYPRRIQLLTMAGILLVLLLAMLDQTIVGTALPRIIANLNGFSEYAWVATAYLLTSTITVPIYGKLSDLFGRKWLLLFAVVLFLIGSALSGASQTMTQLIFFRGFQGLGAGGLISIAIAVVGDIFTPRERAKWQGVTGSVSALASILGPALGGFLTDHISWRWVFYVNLPIGIAAMLVLIFLMPTLRTGTGKAKIDYAGVALLIAGSVPLLLGFSWAGSQYAWNSPQIIGLFIGAAVASVAFVLYEGWLERRGGQPIIEPGLFKNGIFTVSTIVMVVFGAGLFGSIYYISLFAQGVVGFSATNSGFILTPLMITAIAGSIVSGQLVGRFGKYKLIAIVGAVISVVGMGLLLRLDVHSTSTDVVVAMLVLGLGIGVSMSLYTLIVQNALPKKIGQASAGLMFFRSIGSTVGLAAMGSILNTAYPTAFKNALPAALRQPQILSTFNNPQILLQPGVQDQLHKAASAQGPQAVAALNSILEAVKVGLSQSINTVFLVSVIAAVVSLVVVFFLKEIPLRGGPGKKQETAGASEGQAEVEVAALPAL